MAVFDSLLSRIAAGPADLPTSRPGSKLNSTNSSKPPSSDPIGLKRKPPVPALPGGSPADNRDMPSRNAPGPPQKLRHFTDCRPGHRLLQCVGQFRGPDAGRQENLLHRRPARDRRRSGGRVGAPLGGTTVLAIAPKGLFIAAPVTDSAVQAREERGRGDRRRIVSWGSDNNEKNHRPAGGSAGRPPAIRPRAGSSGPQRPCPTRVLQALP